VIYESDSRDGGQEEGEEKEEEEDTRPQWLTACARSRSIGARAGVLK
jgi:hypothetical protein